MKYKHVAIGGTFDLLHDGHKKFIKYALNLGDRVTIGVSSNALAMKLKGETNMGFDERFASVYEFVNINKSLTRVTIVPLNDLFGPTLSDKTIDCLLITRDSLAGANKINIARTKLGLKRLNVEMFLLVKGSDSKVISSGRIRKGIISEQGLNYYDCLAIKGDLYLPQSLRPALKKPVGKIYKNLKSIKAVSGNRDLIATVGDYTTRSFLKSEIFFNLAVIDLKIQRVLTFKSLEDVGFSGKEKILKTASEAGIISQALIGTLNESLKIASDEKAIVLVDGEEDLAVLVLCLLAPLNSLIYYGLRDIGLVEVLVDLTLKEKLLNLINLFRKNN
jgi:cytidyltransferase-like protein